jgi:hypothetical protein
MVRKTKEQKAQEAEDELREEMLEAGIDEESTERILRMMKGESTTEETTQWKNCGVMDEDGKIQIGKDEMKDFSTINLCLWDLCYKGMLAVVHE